MLQKPNLVTTKPVALKVNNDSTWSKSVGIMSHKSKSGGLSGLVRIKSDINPSKQIEVDSQSKHVAVSDNTNKNNTDVNSSGSGKGNNGGFSGSGISLVGNYGSSSSNSSDSE